MTTEVDHSRARTEIKILGKTYALRSDEDPAFANETATLVNVKMREILDKAGTVSPEKVAILAAMNLAADLLKERRQAAEIRQVLRQKTQRLIDLVAAHL